MVNADLQCCQGIGEPFAFRVVQMQIDRFVLCQDPDRTADFLDGPGICHAGGIGHLEFIDAQIHLLFDHIHNRVWVDAAFIAASKGALNAPANG